MYLLPSLRKSLLALQEYWKQHHYYSDFYSLSMAWVGMFKHQIVSNPISWCMENKCVHKPGTSPVSCALSMKLTSTSLLNLTKTDSYNCWCTFTYDGVCALTFPASFTVVLAGKNTAKCVHVFAYQSLSLQRYWKQYTIIVLTSAVYHRCGSECFNTK